MRWIAMTIALTVGAATTGAAQDRRIEFDRFNDLGVPLAPLSVSTPAPPTTRLICEFPNKSSDWIPRRLAIDIAANGAAQTSDPVLSHFNQSPLRATIGRNDSRLLTARWRLRNVRDEDNRRAHHIDYALRFNKARNRANLDAKPFQFINGFNGRGICTPAQ